jgi:aspartyl-tRNA(Asn)/glutamyl-tRNA(Gln) amidotransferase subunit C
MIDREQVLHVAKLARLRLDGPELERMAAELSGVLDHVDKITGLELDSVAPTAHVVELQNVLRDDVAGPSLAPEQALEGAPDPAGDSFRVPSPQA